jgi:hypothetical protein
VLLAACGQALAVRWLVLPLAILAVFAAVCGAINSDTYPDFS